MSFSTDVRCWNFLSPPFSEKTNVLLHIYIIFAFFFLLFLPLTSHLLHLSARVFVFWHDKRVLKLLSPLLFSTSSSNTRKLSGIINTNISRLLFSFSIFFLPSLHLSLYYNWSRGVFSFCMIQIWWQIIFCVPVSGVFMLPLWHPLILLPFFFSSARREDISAKVSSFLSSVLNTCSLRERKISNQKLDLLVCPQSFTSDQIFALPLCFFCTWEKMRRVILLVKTD